MRVRSFVRLRGRSFFLCLFFRSFVRLFGRSFVRSLFGLRSFVCSSVRPSFFGVCFVRWLSRSFVRCFNRSFVFGCPSVLSFVRLVVRSFLRCFSRSIVRSFDHSFDRRLPRPFVRL